MIRDPATTEIYTLSLHDALPICQSTANGAHQLVGIGVQNLHLGQVNGIILKRHLQNTVILGKRKTFTHKTQRRKNQCRSEEHTSELQSRPHLVCRLLLEKKKKK